MAAYDGSIRINTEIDGKGFNTGMNDLSRDAKQTMKAIAGAARGVGAAFWTGAIIASLKASSDQFSQVSSDFGRELMALHWAFLGLQGAIVSGLAPAFAVLFPYILDAINYLTRLFTVLAQISLAFFGIAAATKAAALAQEQMTKAVGKGTLAAFDQLNVLDAKPTLPTVVVPPDLLAQVEAFKLKMLELLAPVTAAFDRLVVSLTPLGQTIWAGLKWAWDNILVPMGGWVITYLLPTFLDLVGAAGKVLDGVLTALKPTAIWLWENFLKPIGIWTGQILLDAMKWLIDRLNEFSDWIKNNQGTVESITKFLVAFGVVWGVISLAVEAWIAISTIATVVTEAFGGAVAFLTSPIGLVVIAVIAIIAIIALLIANWDWVKQAGSDAWDWIVKAWNNAGAWFSLNVVDPIKTAFKSVLDWLGQAWNDTFTGIGNFVKGTVNTIIDFINGMIRAIASGINAVIDGLNSLQVVIPDWVPFFGGQTWGMNLANVGVPQIPRLATGAVIPPNAAFAAILGDQSSGRNIEAPENLIRQIISEEIGKVQAEIVIRFEGTMAQFVQQLKPVLDRENVRIGGNLIQGVVQV